jgi:fumarate reductase flavoprotein subunit
MKLSEPRDYDVIVIGAGGAGLAAAAEAGAAGASVLVVEAGERAGGSTALSGGVIYAAGTVIQKSAGIEDSADAMFNYMLAITQGRLNWPITRRLCDESAPLIEWLQGLGAEFRPELLYKGGLEPPGVKRSHRTEGEGQRLIEILEAAVNRQSADVAYQTRVQDLVIDEVGAVYGIRVGEDVIRSGAVILACGGFGQNRELLERLFPEGMEAGGDWFSYIGNAYSNGDGLLMAQQAGAALGGHDRGLLAMAPRFARDDLYLPAWLMLVNGEGRRFMQEFIPYGVRSRRVMDQPGKTSFALFDEASRAWSKPTKSPLKGAIFYTWTAEYLEEFVAKGEIVAAATLDELAERTGMNPEILRETVAAYNAACAAGVDDRYQKDPQHLRPIATPPFYAAEIRCAALAGTFTGVRIDQDARALDPLDRSIPGLYAAGETSASMGDIYVGGGNAIGNALVFGRVAGRVAADWAIRSR